MKFPIISYFIFIWLPLIGCGRVGKRCIERADQIDFNLILSPDYLLNCLLISRLISLSDSIIRIQGCA